MQTTGKLTRRYPLFDNGDTRGKAGRTVLPDFIKNDEILEILSQVIDKDSNIGGIEWIIWKQYGKQKADHEKALSEIFPYKLTPGLKIYKANSAAVLKKNEEFIFYSPEHKDFLLLQYGTRSCVSACACMLIAGAGYLPNYKVINLGNDEDIKTFAREAHLDEKALIFHKAKSIEEIAKLIKENGSGILSVNDNKISNHVVMLDEINIEDKYAIIRDPWHGWKIKITLNCLKRIAGKEMQFTQVAKACHKHIDLEQWQEREISLEASGYTLITPEDQRRSQAILTISREEIGNSEELILSTDKVNSYNDSLGKPSLTDGKSSLPTNYSEDAHEKELITEPSDQKLKSDSADLELDIMLPETAFNLPASKASNIPQAPKMWSFIFKVSLGISLVLGALGTMALYISKKEGNNLLVKLGTSSLALGMIAGLVASVALITSFVAPNSKLEKAKITELKTDKVVSPA